MMKFPNMIKLLVVLAMVCSLVAIVAAPASAATINSFSPVQGPVGTSVAISVSGFAHNAALTVTFDGAAATTAPAAVTAGDTGAATFSMAVPAAPAGEHTIAVSDGVNEAEATFTVLQKVTVSPTSGPVDTAVTVTGTGFSGAGVTADVTIGGIEVASGVLVDSTGSFTAHGTVPALQSGARTVSATDGAGNDADYTATFTVTPTLKVSPLSGLPGSEVAITGSGWAATPAVTITFAGGNAQAFTPNSSGQISGTYQIPVAASAGVKQILGTQGATTASATFTVSTRLLTISPSSGPKGTEVLVTGSDMTPAGNIAVGNLDFAGADWNTAKILIDSTGAISPTSLVVPNSAEVGANSIVAVDNGSLIAAGTFTVTSPTLAVNPASGPEGTAVTITGTGWLPGAAVTITLAGNVVQTTPDGSGNIAAAMTVPAAAVVGDNAIAAVDTYTNTIDTDVVFTVPAAAITVSPSSGPAGTAVSVTGSGFQGYTPVTVSIGGYTLLTQPLTDSLGSFSATFTIPGLAPGSKSVVVTDNVASSVTAFFVITTAPATIESMLSGISGKLVRVWGYSSGTWSMYDPADAAGSTLTTLTAGNGYWVNVNSAGTLISGGYSYALSSGWNLIGWR